MYKTFYLIIYIFISILSLTLVYPPLSHPEPFLNCSPPEADNDKTLLYETGIKFFSNEVTTDNNFKLENYDIYFIGDGSGKSGNIITSAIGLVAAKDILNKSRKIISFLYIIIFFESKY